MRVFTSLFLLAPIAVSPPFSRGGAEEISLGDNFSATMLPEMETDTTDGRDEWSNWVTSKLSYQLLGNIDEGAGNMDAGADDSAIENNRLGLLIKYQHPFATNWLLQASGQGKIYGRNDYEYTGNDDNIATEFRLNELFLQHSIDRYSIKFGRQTIVWGMTAGNSVLDTLNTTETRDFSIIDVEDARLNQTFLAVDYFQGAGTVSSFVNLYPRFNPPLSSHSPLYLPRSYRQTKFDRDKVIFEMGTQYRWNGSNGDLALMAARLYENQLRYASQVEATSPTIDYTPLANDYTLLGLSANRAIGKLLLTFDLAYSRGVIADVFNTRTFRSRYLRKNKLGTSLGFEVGISNQQQLALALRMESFLDRRAGLEENDRLISDDIFGSYLLRYTHQSLTGESVLTSTWQGDWDGDFTLGTLGLNLLLNNQWSVFTQLIYTKADALSAWGFLDDDLRMEFTLTWTF